MAQTLLLLLAVGVTIYAFVDCLRTGADELRGLPRPLWLVVILLLFPPLGGLVYIVLGRSGGSWRGPGGRPRTTAPDDDPDFLRTLDRPRRQDDDPTPG